MKRIVTLVIVGLLVALACQHQGGKDSSAKGQAAGSADRPVTAIVLPRYQANLPPGPGRDAFAGACLTCHTTRYITMQPPMTATKWEENVRKMIKTYGATIADDQVQPIVQYLMAAKEGGGNGSSWESPAAIVTTPNVTAASAPWPGNPEHGKALYTQNCASCHGADGKSNTPAAVTMLPRPTDLTSGRFSAQAIAASITHGVPGAAMPAAAIHAGDDVNDVVAYVQTLQPAAMAAAPAPTDEAKQLFAKNCTACHGATGTGDGIAAPPLARVPANFHQRQPTVEQATRVITDGVPGTAMASWKTKLTEPQRAALAEYARSFYVEAR